eukprot:COSAG02_NODE_50911_length_317_cov_1.096330_1_plen_59_part_10
MVARGMMMGRMPMRGGGGGAGDGMGGGEPSLNCLRIEERTEEAHRGAVLGCSLLFGWTA